MNIDTVRKLGLVKDITRTSVRLRGFGGDRVALLGEVAVEGEYNERVEQLFAGVMEAADNVLSLNDSKKFGIVNFDEVSKLDNIIRNYVDYYNVNLVKDFKYDLHLKKGTKPWISSMRPVPYAMRPEVSRQIKDLVNKGILVPCDQADWVSPIAVATKPNGSLRVCGEFRKLNEYLIGDSYPLPNIEDLFAEIGSGNNYFAKIDLEAAPPKFC